MGYRYNLGTILFVLITSLFVIGMMLFGYLYRPSPEAKLFLISSVAFMLPVILFNLPILYKMIKYRTTVLEKPERLSLKASRKRKLNKISKIKWQKK